MPQWKPRVPLPYSAEDLERVVSDALRVLQEIGLECPHREVARRLAEWPGAAYERGRVTFAPDPLREHVSEKRARLAGFPQEDDTHFTLGGCWAALYYCDPLTQDVRPAASQEAAQMARLWDARGLHGIVPVVPGDVTPALVTLTAERLALENSRFLGGSLPVADAEEVRFLTDMNLAAGRRYQLLEHVGISPLRLDAGALEVALLFQHNPDLRVTLGGFMPIAGATAPLDPRSALVQAVAESIGFDVLCSVLGFPDGLGLGLYPFDFRYGAIVFGSAEWCLYHALSLQMTEHLTGRPVRHGGFRSTGKRPDPQATLERAASALWQALLGVRHFGAVGQLSTDEVFSPQQAVLDREILGYVERVVRGIDLGPPEVDPVELIGAGVREGSFLGVMDTVTRFRDFYHFPDIFRHWTVRGWRTAGQPSILTEAWTRAQEEITSSRFHLADDQARAVKNLYAKACAYLQGRPSTAREEARK